MTVASMTNASKARAVLNAMCDSLTPRMAARHYMCLAADPDRFMVDVLPIYADLAGVPNGAQLVRRSGKATDLMYSWLRSACHDDHRPVYVEPVYDEDIYDGYGGYAHNSDDGPLA
jgi:hypothetical protein